MTAGYHYRWLVGPETEGFALRQVAYVGGMNANKQDLLALQERGLVRQISLTGSWKWELTPKGREALEVPPAALVPA